MRKMYGKSSGCFVSASLCCSPYWCFSLPLTNTLEDAASEVRLLTGQFIENIFVFPPFKLNEWNERTDQLIILVARLWVIKVSDLGGLINEFDPKEAWQDRVSGCLVLIIYACPIIHGEKYRASSSNLKFINITQQSRCFQDS